MTIRSSDPRRLDVSAFAQSSGAIEGEVALRDLPRLAEGCVSAGDAAVPPVRWSARGLWRQPAGRPAETRLRLTAQAEVWLPCQRCLEPVHHRLEVDRVLRFVVGEDAAARLDEESDEDVLALQRGFDLLELIEDELILELPIVPRHDHCPVDLAVHAVADEPVHPFAALRSLKAGGQE